MGLPIQLTPLIGREREVATVVELITGHKHILTLTGPGGAGKTRVGLQAATQLVDRFEHGVGFVNLASVNDVELVAPTIAMSLGLKEVAGEPPIETLVSNLRDKRMLLLVDNFEQVSGAASQVSRLAAAAPGVRMLVTSRVPLRVRGEYECPVPPLELDDAVRLFVERAAAINPDFAVTQENRHVITEICARLDGLPLAVELAAARIRLLSPTAMLSRLRNRLRLLTGGPRDAEHRQRTLRGTIEWSHNLLGAQDAQLFRRMAVFHGGCTLAAVEAVCGEPDVLDGVESLVRNNLLRQEADRFVMLETIHEFAREKLAESGELDELRQRHADHFTEPADPEEMDNLRAALEWTEGTERGARLAAALWRFWFLHGHWQEGADWIRRTLPHADRATRANLLYGGGYFAIERGDYAEGRRLLQESVSVYAEVGDPLRSALALGKVGDIAYAVGDYETAGVLLEEVLATCRELGDVYNVARQLTNLAELRRAQGDYATARRLNEEAAATVDHHVAEFGSISVWHNLANVVHREGDCERALELFTYSLELARERDDRLNIAMCLVGFAGVAGSLGTPRRAARLYGAADRLLETLGARLWPADRIDYDFHLSRVRAQLDPASFEELHREGRAMSTREAITLALDT